MNAQSKHLTKQSELSDKDGKVTLLRYLIKQSFNQFNIYGKEPDALADIFQGFMLVLSPYSNSDIQTAFNKWLHEKKIMPVPADILEIVRENLKFRSGAYQKPFGDSKAAPEQPKNAVPWYGMMFEDIERKVLLPQIRVHLASFVDDERREDYLKYLKFHCKFPVDF